MNDLRGKVIRGLECCMRPNDTNLCGECPYSETSDTLFGCMQRTMYDALSLLKAQEPRVMTLEEVQTWATADPELRDPVFYEDLILKKRWWITHDNDGIYLPAVRAGEGRCWTSRPTDKQREATPWN